MKITISPASAVQQYDVHIGEQALDLLIAFLERRYPHSRIAVVTDKTVHELHGSSLKDDLLAECKNLWISIPPGELSKSRQQKESIEAILLDNKYGRDSLLIAFGGGVVGDLTGFVAATYQRGIPFIQIPTTMMAMVDSSIGGKTGINVAQGKNLIGSIHQPVGVFIHPEFLATLPLPDYLHGLAESIKMAVCLDSRHFVFIEDNIKAILDREKPILSTLIVASIGMKKAVIDLDPDEKGLREVLNFGHTVGHALETISEYREKHGICVARGMVIEALIANQRGFLDDRALNRFIDLIGKSGFDLDPGSIDEKELWQTMTMDKKARNNKPKMIRLTDIGSYHHDDITYSYPFERDELRNALGDFRKFIAVKPTRQGI